MANISTSGLGRHSPFRAARFIGSITTEAKTPRCSAWFRQPRSVRRISVRLLTSSMRQSGGRRIEQRWPKLCGAMASRLLHLRRSGKTGTRSSPLVGAIDKFATMQLGQNPSLRALADLGRFWVNRYTGDPAASPAMSAMPPKAEVNSEH